jgi:hypothetical protein
LVNGVALKSFTKALSFSAAQLYDGSKNPKKLAYLSKGERRCKLFLLTAWARFYECSQLPPVSLVVRLYSTGRSRALCRSTEGLFVAV